MISHFADTPFQEEELLCLKVFKQLVRYRWGCQAFFSNQKAIRYILDRTKYMNQIPQTGYSGANELTNKSILEKKYSLIN